MKFKLTLLEATVVVVDFVVVAVVNIVVAVDVDANVVVVGLLVVNIIFSCGQ